MTRCHSCILQGLVLFFLTGLSTPRSVDEISDRRLQANTTAAPTTATMFPVVEPITDGAQAREALDTALALWISSGIMAYELGFTRVCECTEEYVAPSISKVENGVIVEVRNVNGTFVDPGSSLFQDAYSVEILFEKLETALEENVYEIRVDYDETYGYPTSVYIDYDVNLADDEFQVMIDSFQRVDGATTDGSQTTYSTKRTQEALNEAMARWESWSRFNNYCIQVTQRCADNSCFLGGSLEWVPVGGGASNLFYSVEDYFFMIQSALDKEADVIEVFYNGMKGNPVVLYIDSDADNDDDDSHYATNGWIQEILVLAEGEVTTDSTPCVDPSSAAFAPPFLTAALILATLVIVLFA